MTGALVLAVVQRELHLEARDERVKVQLQAAIDDARERAEVLENEARSLRLQARRIESATADEEWWHLRGILSAADIESLSNVSPTALLGEEGKYSPRRTGRA